MIDFYFGLPGEGKTFLVTKRTMEQMKRGRKVFSNYPIIFRHKGKMLSSYVWEDRYALEPIAECDIIIDEAYRYASSRDWKNFSKDDHTFFATSGHMGINIVIITQAVPRVDVIIRELVGQFHLVRKTSIPWFKRDPRGYYEKILWFLEEVYLQDNKQAGIPSTEIWTKSHSMFNKEVAKAYDTKYYRRHGDLSFVPELWSDKLKISDKAMIDSGVKAWLKRKMKKAEEPLSTEPLTDLME